MGEELRVAENGVFGGDAQALVVGQILRADLDVHVALAQAVHDLIGQDNVPAAHVGIERDLARAGGADRLREIPGLRRLPRGLRGCGGHGGGALEVALILPALCLGGGRVDVALDPVLRHLVDDIGVLGALEAEFGELYVLLPAVYVPRFQVHPAELPVDELLHRELRDDDLVEAVVVQAAESAADIQHCHIRFRDQEGIRRLLVLGRQAVFAHGGLPELQTQIVQHDMDLMLARVGRESGRLQQAVHFKGHIRLGKLLGGD
jgi:hypothetical protein